MFSLYISFFDWPLVGEPAFIGLQNYTTILTDDADFVRSLKVTLKFAAMFVPANLIVALLLAMLLRAGWVFMEPRTSENPFEPLREAAIAGSVLTHPALERVAVDW